jgi:PAS domain S-box-containing protein
MDETVGITGLAVSCARAEDVDQVVTTAVAALPALCGAAAVQHVHPGDEPDGWGPVDAVHVERHPLPGLAGDLLLAWDHRPTRPDPLLDAALAVVATAVGRGACEAENADLVTRVDDAQRLANMGDYDWHIASDTNRWSDQLYRIYGHEPQSFNASYERFLSMLHPDDREHIVAVHQEAYRTGEPYQMTERVLRPDGELRYLASNGQVLMDAGGTPLRFRGTCIDITDRVLAEQEREEAAAHAAEHASRRRQALELNDSVVQGLVAAAYALELEDIDQAARHVSGTLAAARSMMDDLLDPAERDELTPGDLVRSAPARFDEPQLEREP